MKNYKIKKKMQVAFGTVIAVFCVAILASIISLQRVGGLENKLYAGPYVIVANAQGVFRDTNALGLALRSAVLEENIADYEELLNTTLNSAEGRIGTLKGVVGQTGPMTSVEDSFQTLKEKTQEAVAAMKAGDWEEAKSLVLGDCYEAAQACGASADIIAGNAAAMADEFDHSAGAITLGTFVLMVILSAGALATAVAIAVRITKGLTYPVAEIEEAAKKMAEGDFSVKVAYESRDELGSLAESIRKMTERVSFYVSEMTSGMEQLADCDLDVRARERFLGDFRPVQMAIRKLIDSMNDIIAQISASADSVAAGSDQVSGSAQTLSEGATEQAGAVEELNAVIDGVAGLADRSARETQEACGRIEESVRKARERSAEMEKLTQAMERIDATSKEIGNIIAAIEDIASQTNLLSLNASIEAARAGEAGRGFAVVADQIGKLATDSAQSAVSTRDLIGKTLEEIEVGNAVVRQTAQAFAEVIDEMNSFTELVKESSDRSVEQSNSLKQVKAGIEQISDVVQSNAASAQETSAASQELAAQSDSLKMLVGRFRLSQK